MNNNNNKCDRQTSPIKELQNTAITSRYFKSNLTKYKEKTPLIARLKRLTSNLNEFEQNEKLEKLRKQSRSTDNLLELDQEQFDFYDSNHNQITNVEQTPQNQKAPAKTLNRSKTYTSLKSSQFFLPNVTPVNDKRLIDKSSFANTCHLARELANINLQDDYSSKSAEMNIVKAKSKSKL